MYEQLIFMYARASSKPSEKHAELCKHLCLLVDPLGHLEQVLVLRARVQWKVCSLFTEIQLDAQLVFSFTGVMVYKI